MPATILHHHYPPLYSDTSNLHLTHSPTRFCFIRICHAAPDPERAHFPNHASDKIHIRCISIFPRHPSFPLHPQQYILNYRLQPPCSPWRNRFDDPTTDPSEFSSIVENRSLSMCVCASVCLPVYLPTPPLPSPFLSLSLSNA